MGSRWRLVGKYLWLGFFVAAVATALIVQQWTKDAVVASIAAILGAFYFVQQQRLEEARLFKELFTEFNKRYDRLNGYLARIYKAGALDDVLQAKFIDYFNLCSEEFLFYRRGYIYQEVWKSWCRGMLQYLRIPCVRELWESEVITGSYYGLTYQEIKQGAA